MSTTLAQLQYTLQPELDGALCAQSDPDAWFPDPGDPAPLAKAVCRRCPVQDACLDHALANDERHGVWGGLTPGERVELRQYQHTSEGR